MQLKNLDHQSFSTIFANILDAKIPHDDAKDVLLELNEIGFTKNMFLGAMQALKSRMTEVKAPKNAIDICGTGGDGLDTLNISTAVCFVVAACGVVVAKHGNKAVSSKSGSADIFDELGIEIAQDPQKIAQNLKKNGLAFIFAPFFHQSLKQIAKIRQEIAVEYGQATIFNYLGPLLNPANVRRQFIGTSRFDTMLPMLEALKEAGSARVHIVHGFDKMDEITLCDDSYLLKLEGGKISEQEIIRPEKFGLKKCKIADLKGQDPAYNAQKLRSLLDGEKSAYRDIVVLNAAFILKLANTASKIPDNIIAAQDALDKGHAEELLIKLQKNG